MFDIGFWELVLVAIVSLIVFGPERLPRVAREAALWIKKMRTVLITVKQEINRELQLQDIKQGLLEEKTVVGSNAMAAPNNEPSSVKNLKIRSDSNAASEKTYVSVPPNGEG